MAKAPSLVINLHALFCYHMNQNHAGGDDDLSLRKLHPHWTEEQLEIAEEKLDRYLELMLRIYNRILKDPKAWAEFEALTASRKGVTIPSERSFPPSHS